MIITNIYVNIYIVKSINGTVHHECSATPTQFEPYRGIMRKRVLDAGTPQRTVQVLGQNNQPVFVPGASNAMQSTGFSDFVVSKHFISFNQSLFVGNNFFILIFYIL